MEQLNLLRELIETYRRHGWTLREVLLSSPTKELLARAENSEARNALGEAVPREFAVDALWFSRPSERGREAWELRLVSAVAYALFELFEPDEAEEDRAEVRREMEAQLRARFSEKSEAESQI
jgi:hypothetical protein